MHQGSVRAALEWDVFAKIWESEMKLFVHSRYQTDCFQIAAYGFSTNPRGPDLAFDWFRSTSRRPRGKHISVGFLIRRKVYRTSGSGRIQCILCIRCLRMKPNQGYETLPVF